MRPRRREPVSGVSFQIGSRNLITIGASISGNVEIPKARWHAGASLSTVPCAWRCGIAPGFSARKPSTQAANVIVLACSWRSASRSAATVALRCSIGSAPSVTSRLAALARLRASAEGNHVARAKPILRTRLVVGDVNR